MANTIEITFDDGSMARWAIASDEAVDRVVAAIVRLVGSPDSQV